MTLPDTAIEIAPARISSMHEPEPETATSEFLRLLWSGRDLILRVTFGAFLVTLAVVLLIPNWFDGVAKIMPPEGNSNATFANFVANAGSSSGGGGGALPMMAADLLGGKTTKAAVYSELLQSRTVADRLVQQFELQKVYWKRYVSDAREKLRDNTRIVEDRKSGIITIFVSDHDKQRAAALARAYVEELNSLLTQIDTSAAHRERVFLEERLTVVLKEMDIAAKELGEYSTKYGALDMTEQGKATVEAAAKLQAELIIAEAQLQSLKQVYTNDHPRVRMLSGQVAELRSQLNKVSGLSGEQDLNMPFPSIRQLPRIGVGYMERFRRYKVAEAVYEALTKQFEMSKVDEAKQLPTVKLVDAPEVPERKAGPPRLILSIAGAFAGFSFAVAWLILAALWGRQSPDGPGRRLATDIMTDVRKTRVTSWLAVRSRTAVMDPKRSQS